VFVVNVELGLVLRPILQLFGPVIYHANKLLKLLNNVLITSENYKSYLNCYMHVFQ